MPFSPFFLIQVRLVMTSNAPVASADLPPSACTRSRTQQLYTPVFSKNSPHANTIETANCMSDVAADETCQVTKNTCQDANREYASEHFSEESVQTVIENPSTSYNTGWFGPPPRQQFYEQPQFSRPSQPSKQPAFDLAPTPSKHGTDSDTINRFIAA